MAICRETSALAATTAVNWSRRGQFFSLFVNSTPAVVSGISSGVGDYSLYRLAWKVRALTRRRPGEGYTCARSSGTTPPRVDRQGGVSFGLTVDCCDASPACAAGTATDADKGRAAAPAVAARAPPGRDRTAPPTCHSTDAAPPDDRDGTPPARARAQYRAHAWRIRAQARRRGAGGGDGGFGHHEQSRRQAGNVPPRVTSSPASGASRAWAAMRPWSSVVRRRGCRSRSPPPTRAISRSRIIGARSKPSASSIPRRAWRWPRQRRNPRAA